jgi:membrane-associated protease RseP (regulator of RpoE activity)
MQNRVLAVVSLLVLALSPLTAVARPTEIPYGIQRTLGIECLTDDYDTGGLRVASIVPGSAAQLMGFQPGDILVELDEESVHSMHDVHRILSQPQTDLMVARVKRHGGMIRLCLASRDMVWPQLPSYEIVEGKGIPEVACVGEFLADVVDRFGTPTHDSGQVPMPAMMSQQSDTIPSNDGAAKTGTARILRYPLCGVTVISVPVGHNDEVVTGLVFTYPFVGRLKGGPATNATVAEIERRYGNHDGAVRRDENGLQALAIPKRGLEFIWAKGQPTITAIVVTTPQK